MPKSPDRFFILMPLNRGILIPLESKEWLKSPDMVPMIEVFFSEGVDARLESFTVSVVLRSSNGMSPEVGEI